MPDVILTFAYRSKDKGSSLRRVKATSLSWISDPGLDGRLLLRAYDVDRKDWRTFRFEGIVNSLCLEEPPLPPPPKNEGPIPF